MRYRLAVVVGRALRWILRIRGGGSAVPGRVALMIAPHFLQRAVSRFPLGIIFVSGSNGKSTTTNMLTAILREHGLKVFTNPSGGNLPQGLASSVIASVPIDGYLAADIGVLEVDEAYGVALAASLRPATVLLLNVQIDQLNRFFEPDRVVAMLRAVAETSSANLVVNADDDSLRRIGVELDSASRSVAFFGAAASLIAASPHGLANVEELTSGSDTPARQLTGGESTVTVTDLEGRTATLEIDGVKTSIELPARGLHYALDAAGAVATSQVVLGERFSRESARAAFSTLHTVYGRGEVIVVGGEEIEIIMMKNPPSLQLNLDYLVAPPEQLLMAVDEGTPDPSWIYDTDFSALDHVDVMTGTKAWQFATRLAYSVLPVERVLPDLRSAVQAFLALPRPSRGSKVMIVNYEQMMLIRKQLGFLDLEGGEV